MTSAFNRKDRLCTICMCAWRRLVGIERTINASGHIRAQIWLQAFVTASTDLQLRCLQVLFILSSRSSHTQSVCVSLPSLLSSPLSQTQILTSLSRFALSLSLSLSRFMHTPSPLERAGQWTAADLHFHSRVKAWEILCAQAQWCVKRTRVQCLCFYLTQHV